MAPQEIHMSGVDSVDAVIDKLNELQLKGNVFVLFGGEKDSSGNSWCPQCTQGEAAVEKAVSDLSPADNFLVHVNIGPRPGWKDPENHWRKHETFKLTSVPTLIKWKTPMKLVETQCWDEDMLTMMIQD